MKNNIFFLFYQYLIALPIILVVTVLVAISTIILSPLLPNSNISYFPARWWGRIICRILFIRVSVTGLDKFDLKESYIIAANHQSVFDIFAIYGWLPNIFKWIMKAELRQIPLVGKACESAGHIFIDRTNPLSAKTSLEKAEKQLINGISVVIFPEGTRTKTGEMNRFKKGAFRIATDLSLPILPVTIRGSFERLPRNTFVVHPGVIEMIFHEPVDVRTYLPDNTAELIQHTWQIIHDDL
ncbi:MAG: lysophospholipid acyltransferase family protein [Paludibacter sp.]|nr:lysophospholipid acyltransferase family protein [Paludibacter sp.]